MTRRARLLGHPGRYMSPKPGAPADSQTASIPAATCTRSACILSNCSTASGPFPRKLARCFILQVLEDELTAPAPRQLNDKRCRATSNDPCQKRWAKNPRPPLRRKNRGGKLAPTDLGGHPRPLCRSASRPVGRRRTRAVAVVRLAHPVPSSLLVALGSLGLFRRRGWLVNLYDYTVTAAPN